MLDSNDIRKKTIALSCNTNAGHLAPSLSCVEILTTLFRDFLNYNQNDAKDNNRDRLIFSKGHGAYAYYIILNELGFLPNKELENFYDSASIKGCLTKNAEYMIEASTGSLGHGLPIAVGMAQAFKMQNTKQKVVCIVGDGEMQEGSNFEALGLAYKFKLDNLLLIVDANSFQAMDRVEDVGLDNNRLAKVLNAYTDNFSQIDGHDEIILKQKMDNFFNYSNDSLSILVCDTIKGKGVDVCENSIAHHFRCPTQDGYVLGCDDE
ncbi:MAG: thiamine pyrophosphate-dependent enzyme [Sulfurimonas sp.]|jgi:transketolase|nr:thiamine pyrophosphate-dependent enzyme [Sulfurimonas sp.]